jgi:hypothetical protein
MTILQIIPADGRWFARFHEPPDQLTTRVVMWALVKADDGQVRATGLVLPADGKALTPADDDSGFNGFVLHVKE